MEAPPPALPTRCNCCEWWLVFLLRINAVALWVAVTGLLMPLDWMVRIHERLGLGPLPTGPVFEYLARTESALYVVLGGALWIVAMDLRRYAPLVSYFICARTVFGVAVTVVDGAAGLPLRWAIPECALTAGLGVVMWLLWKQIPLEPTART